MLHSVIAGKKTSERGVVVDSIEVKIEAERNSEVLLMIKVRPKA